LQQQQQQQASRISSATLVMPELACSTGVCTSCQ
jgi:hypothetical protein